MRKNSEDKLIDAIITLHQVIKKQGQNTQKQLAKMNLAVGELRLSYMKLEERVSKLDTNLNGTIKTLDGSFNRYAESNEARLSNHEARIMHLEKMTPGGSLVVSEPSVRYKRKKGK